MLYLPSGKSEFRIDANVSAVSPFSVNADLRHPFHLGTFGTGIWYGLNHQETQTYGTDKALSAVATTKALLEDVIDFRIM